MVNILLVIFWNDFACVPETQLSFLFFSGKDKSNLCSLTPSIGKYFSDLQIWLHEYDLLNSY